MPAYLMPLIKTKGKIIMCSTPKMPTAEPVKTETIATPTLADASVTKSSATTKNKAQSLANRNIKTSARGLLDDATTQKKGLLGD